jgi:hypothetical protein
MHPLVPNMMALLAGASSASYAGGVASMLFALLLLGPISSSAAEAVGASLRMLMRASLAGAAVATGVQFGCIEPVTLRALIKESMEGFNSSAIGIGAVACLPAVL